MTIVKISIFSTTFQKVNNSKVVKPLNCIEKMISFSSNITLNAYQPS